MTGTMLAEGHHQRVTSARMNMACGQQRLARCTRPGALPQARVIGDLWPNRISGYLRSNAQQVKRQSFKKLIAPDNVYPMHMPSGELVPWLKQGGHSLRLPGAACRVWR